jgi:hypothetical protein
VTNHSAKVGVKYLWLWISFSSLSSGNSVFKLKNTRQNIRLSVLFEILIRICNCHHNSKQNSELHSRHSRTFIGVYFFCSSNLHYYFFLFNLQECSNLSRHIKQQCWRGMIVTCRGYIQWCISYESTIKKWLILTTGSLHHFSHKLWTH